MLDIIPRVVIFLKTCQAWLIRLSTFTEVIMNHELFARKFVSAVLVLGFLFLLPSAKALADKTFSQKDLKAKATSHPNSESPKTSPFQSSPWGDFPHYGSQNDPGQGYQHYDLRSRHYGHWYQPKQFGLTLIERCSAPLFRPRGYGNLFNRPSNCYRMDYNRYLLENHRSDYGPSYYHNLPDPRCTKTTQGSCENQ